MTMTVRVATMLSWLERLLFLVSVLCVTVMYATWRHTAFHELYARSARDGLLSALHRPNPESRTTSVDTDDIRDGSLIGVLEVPRLELLVAVLEGVDSRALALAAGHLPSTPLPWQHGNSAVAGHRDTFFRSLKGVHLGDRIRLVTAHGTLEYRVSDILVVDPHALWVLDAANDVTLTLITCYPFEYVGPAPGRFVVRARRVSRSTPASRAPRCEIKSSARE